MAPWRSQDRDRSCPQNDQCPSPVRRPAAAVMIYKAPHTNVETCWHQDVAYWLDMPDKRAVSCWVCHKELSFIVRPSIDVHFASLHVLAGGSGRRDDRQWDHVVWQVESDQLYLCHYISIVTLFAFTIDQDLAATSSRRDRTGRPRTAITSCSVSGAKTGASACP